MKTEIINTRHLSESEKEELYTLFQQFYAATNYEKFCCDLAEKEWLIRQRDGKLLAGFSTQQTIRLHFAEKPVRFLFSGDTITHPAYWNKSYLAGAFGQLFQKIAAEDSSPLYWFLISKGFRTYRVMPIFFHDFYPVYTEKNGHLKPLLDAVATYKFGNSYNPQTEIVELPGENDHLKGKLANIPENYLGNPHVKFFAERNPRYKSGTELACLTPLQSSNLTKCSLRVIQATRVHWHA